MQVGRALDALVLVGDEAAGGLLGDRGEVRREQHRGGGRDEGAVGPVVPVPGLLLARPGSAGRGPLRSCGSLHWPRSVSTALSMSVRSVNSAVDAPVEQLAHLVGVVDGPHVHVPPGRVRPPDEARRDDRRAGRDGAGPGTRSTALRLSRAAPAGRSAASRNSSDLDRAWPRSAPGRRSARGSAPSGVAENEPTRTRSHASRAAMKSASAATAPSDLRSMLNRASGNASNSSASVGTASRPPTSAPRTSAWLSCGDLAAPVGDPVEHAVVEGEQHAVAGHVHVGLEVVGSRGPPRAGTPPGCSPAPRSRGGSAPPRCANASTEPGRSSTRSR